MNNTIFEISDYYELLNLHKALLEAKFHDNIDNRYVAGSPIVAQTHNKIIKALISMELEKKGKENWSEWIEIHNRSDYKDKIIDNIVKFEPWDDNNKKTEILKAYMSPFVATEEEILSIIQQIDLIKNCN